MMVDSGNNDVLERRTTAWGLSKKFTSKYGVMKRPVVRRKTIGLPTH